MSYTVFFLLGIPFWLIASARVLRASRIDTNRPRLKFVWAALAFFVPLVIFGLGSIAHVLIERQVGELAAWTRGFGYFLIVVNLFAFFSAFVVSSMFESRYGVSKDRVVSP